MGSSFLAAKASETSAKKSSRRSFVWITKARFTRCWEFVPAFSISQVTRQRGTGPQQSTDWRPKTSISSSNTKSTQIKQSSTRRSMLQFSPRKATRSIITSSVWRKRRTRRIKSWPSSGTWLRRASPGIRSSLWPRSKLRIILSMQHSIIRKCKRTSSRILSLKQSTTSQNTWLLRWPISLFRKRKRILIALGVKLINGASNTINRHSAQVDGLKTARLMNLSIKRKIYGNQNVFLRSAKTNRASGTLWRINIE